MSSSKSRLSPASNGMMKRGQILMKVLRESGRPLKEYVIVFLLDNRGIDNCINRNTRVLRRFATKAGSGSRKSSRSCQPCLVAQMSIVRHRDLSCPLKLKPRNSDTSNTKPTHRTLNGLSLNGYVVPSLIPIYLFMSNSSHPHLHRRSMRQPYNLRSMTMSLLRLFKRNRHLQLH